MIRKIKGLIDSEKHISELLDSSKESVRATKENKNSVAELRTQLTHMKDELKELSTHNKKTVKKLNEDMGSVRELKEQLKSEIMDFKVLKTKLKEKLVDEIGVTFRSELANQIERLKTDVQSYNDLKQQLQIITSTIDQTKLEFIKFNNISQGIKENDFKLSGYINKITALDQEKLRLMKKVDDLQRLIAAERRKRR